MAIALDGTSSSGTFATITSFSWPHTTAGTGLILIVGAQTRDPTDADQTIGSITYAGTTLTKIRSDQDTGGASHTRSELWYVKSPTTGLGTISLYLGGTTEFAAGNGISLTGVDQTTPIGSNAGTRGLATGGSVALTIDNTNSWMVDSIYSKSGSNLTIGANQTQIHQLTISSDRAAASYEGTVSNPGTMSWSFSTTDDFAMSAAVVNPTIPPPSVTTVGWKTLLGVGRG